MKHWIVVALLLVACSEETKQKVKDKADKVDKALDESDQSDFAERITEIRAAMTAGQSTTAKCAGALSLAEGDTSANANEIRTLCEHDVPLASATRAVEAAEKARAAAKPGDVVSECFEAAWETANDKLSAKHPTDPAFVALKDRWAKACPP